MSQVLLLKRLGLTHEVLLDDQDHERLSRFGWVLVTAPRSKTIYVRRQIGNEFRYIHHDLLPPITGAEVAHINGNGLDNRRENLCYRSRSRVMRKTYERLGDEYNIYRAPPKTRPPKAPNQHFRSTIKRLANGQRKTYFYDKVTGQRLSVEDVAAAFPDGFPALTAEGLQNEHSTNKQTKAV